MLKKLFLFCIFCLNSLFPCFAKNEILLPEDTEVSIILTESVSSANATVGERIPAEVAEDVIVDGKVLIKEGSSVKILVTQVQKKKWAGRGGDLSLEMKSVKAVDGKSVPLISATGRGGKNNTASTVTLTVLFGLPGLLRRGEDAYIKEGTEFTAFVEKDTLIDFDSLDNNVIDSNSNLD